MKNEMQSLNRLDKTNGEWFVAGASELFDGEQLALAAFGTECENDDSGIKAFAYLWRRFGPPWFGSDSHKDLCLYALSTDDKEVIITISPTGSALKYGIGVGVTKKLNDQFEEQTRKAYRAYHRAFKEWLKKTFPKVFKKMSLTKTWEEQPEFYDSYWKAFSENQSRFEAEVKTEPLPDGDPAIKSRVETAVLDALRELKRPVHIRDCPINIFGRYKEELFEEKEPCQPSPYAGYGMDKNALDAKIK